MGTGWAQVLAVKEKKSLTESRNLKELGKDIYILKRIIFSENEIMTIIRV